MYIKDRPIIEILNAVDLVLSPYSTVLSEAAALKKPFIILDLYSEDYSAILGSKKLLISSEPEELAFQIRKSLFDSKFRKEYILEMERIAQNQYGKLDGKASERIAAEIINLINEKKSGKKI